MSFVCSRSVSTRGASRRRWASAAAASIALAVLGCGGRARHTVAKPAEDTPDPRGREGELLALNALGQPFVDTPLLVDGALIYTGDDGFAVLPEVGATYDVSLLTHYDAFEVQGLRSRAPVIEFFSLDGDPSERYSAELRVPSLPAGSGDDTGLRFMAGLEEFTPHRPLISYYDSGVELDWAAVQPATLTAEVFLIETDRLNGAPLAYSGYAAGEWPDVASSVTWEPDYAAPAFEVASLHVDVTMPAGATVSYFEAVATDALGRRGRLGHALPSAEDSSSASTDLLVPDLPDVTFSVRAVTALGDSNFTAQGPDGVRVGDRVELVAPMGPVPLTPAGGSVVDFDTEFTWTAVAGALYRLNLVLSTDSANYALYVTTAQAHARIPDLGALGIPFSEVTSVSWNVDAFAGVPSLDEYAAGAPTHGDAHSPYRDATFALSR